ncbi:MAG TPA: hypothetical protein VMT92_03365 [Steroidobacteraceae bacterium]|nr:hypothetical protein [Steroidobacteraceae bacterium]
MALVFASLPAASDPLGLYIGAGAGQAQVKADVISFDRHHAGWKVLAGLRPVPIVGAEPEYVDFGHPSVGFPSGHAADSSAQATGAFGLL